MNKLTKTLLTILPAGVVLLPLKASAQLLDDDFEGLADNIGDLVESLLPIIAGIALLAFFWGLAKYVFQADDEEAKDKGKQIMIAGIVALFLIAAVGGIVEFLADAFVGGSGDSINPSGIDD